MLSYIFQVTICWVLFALLYSLLLRRETFFSANRIYLLGAVAAGLLLPFAFRVLPGLPVSQGAISVFLPMLTVGLQQVEETAAQWAGLTYLWWGYIAGLTLTALRLLAGLFKLGIMAVQHDQERLPDGCQIIRLPNARLPFSFFHWIFVPAGFDTADAESKNMLAHEQAHAHGWHSVDVLLLEILCVVAWFHPLAHWYRRALRSVHEYLADAAAANQTDRRQYGLLLLQQVQPALALPFANHFFQSPLKQRLLMLTKNNSGTGHIWKYFLAIPLTLFVWACSQSETLDQAISPMESAKPEAASALLEIEKLPEFPGGMQALFSYLAANIQYPEAAKRAGAEGKIMLQITIDKNGSVSQVAAVPTEKAGGNQRQDMIDEAIRVVAAMPKWAPAYKNGAAVSCSLTLPIQFKLE